MAPESSRNTDRAAALDSAPGVDGAGVVVHLERFARGQDLAAVLGPLFPAPQPVRLASQYLALRLWTVEPEDGQTFRSYSCLAIDVASRQCRHNGQTLAVPLHILRLLSLFERQPDQAWTLAQCNQAAARKDWPQWSRDTFRVAAHFTRKLLPGHLVAVRSIGYFFHPCGQQPVIPGPPRGN